MSLRVPHPKVKNLPFATLEVADLGPPDRGSSLKSCAVPTGLALYPELTQGLRPGLTYAVRFRGLICARPTTRDSRPFSLTPLSD